MNQRLHCSIRERVIEARKNSWSWSSPSHSCIRFRPKREWLQIARLQERPSFASGLATVALLPQSSGKHLTPARASVGLRAASRAYHSLYRCCWQSCRQLQRACFEAKRSKSWSASKPPRHWSTCDRRSLGRKNSEGPAKRGTISSSSNSHIRPGPTDHSARPSRWGKGWKPNAPNSSLLSHQPSASWERSVNDWIRTLWIVCRLSESW